MSIGDLNEFELLQGFFSLLFVVVSILVGVRLISKYFVTEGKNKVYITIGLTYIFLSSAWWGVAVSFLAVIFTGTQITEFWYVFIANAFIFLSPLFWLYSFFKLMTIKHNKVFWHISWILLITYEIFSLILVINDYTSIAIMAGKFNTKRTLFTLLFDIIAIFVSLITGILFSLDSIKSGNPNLVWKGRFLMIAFISLTIGSICDAILPLNSVNLIIVRIILTSSAVEYYFGFFLPKKLFNRLI